MRSRQSRSIAAVFLGSAVILGCAIISQEVLADSVRLTNGDTIVGKVISLDENQLVLQSENFGEMKIPRGKVGIIGLGDKPLTEALGGANAAAPAASGELPSLQSPQVRQQIDRLLEQSLGGGLGNMRQQMESSRRGLRELQKDLGPGSSADALDGYIRMFELFGAGEGSEPPAPETPESSENSERAENPSVE